jgi:hypothetical protein
VGATGFLDACGFTPTTGGTGTFTVSANISGYQTPASAGALNGGTYSYRAHSADLTQWEVGYGVYTVSGTTLSRTVTANSLGTTAAVNFTAAPNVYITALSADLRNASLLGIGTVPPAQLGSGSAAANTFLEGDNAWKAGTLAKAWVNFVGSSAAINASYNVASVTRNSAGDYTITFTNAMSGANSYVVVAFSEWTNINTDGGFMRIKNGTRAAGSFGIQNMDYNSGSFAFVDAPSIHVVVFGT